MKCPACCSEIDDRSYRCRECHGLCSYRRLCWRYRYLVLGIVALIGLWTIKGYVRRWYANDYDKLPEGALVSDATTLSWLGLRDKGWFCEEPHYKGRLLHLRHKVFQSKDVIIFVHGFIGDYVNTWGKPEVLLDRAKDFPSKQPYKIHRIVMFTPLTENVSLAGQPKLVKLLGEESADIAQMQASTYSELGRVKEDLKALLDAQDPLTAARKEAFMKDVAEHLYIINAERDEVVDVGPNGEKIVSEGLRKLSQLPTLGPPRLVTLRYSDIGGSEEDARETKSSVRDPAYAHGIVVKMGGQQEFSFFDHFEELLFDRIGTPPRNSAANVEQIRQSAQERIQDTIFEMNKFVVDKNPMVGLAWKDISDAVQAKFKDVPEPDRTKQVEDLTRQTYYVYIFLSLYARMDDLRSRGILSPNDEMILGWKRSWLPNLMTSELGRWMLENNLMEYYSEPMIKDLREAAGATGSSPTPPASTR